MAKCVVNKIGQALRVSDQEAAEIVEKGGRYISKGDYQRAMAGKWTPEPPRPRRGQRVEAHA